MVIPRSQAVLHERTRRLGLAWPFVTRQTKNPEVVRLSSSYSEAGTEVIVGVRPQRARWRCIGYRDGTTAGIMSLNDEGSM